MVSFFSTLRSLLYRESNYYFKDEETSEINRINSLLVSVFSSISSNNKYSIIVTDKHLQLRLSVAVSWLQKARVILPNGIRPENIDYVLDRYKKEISNGEVSLFISIKDNLTYCGNIKELYPSLQIIDIDVDTEVIGNLYNQNKNQSISQKLESQVDDFILHNDYETELFLTQYTSGSTGVPKEITRSLASFKKEYESIADLLPNEAYAIGTVPMFHAYGIMFRFFVPIFKKYFIWNDPIEYPEQFVKIDELLNIECNKRQISQSLDKSLFIISSPGFIKRLDGRINNIALMVSAGSRLDSRDFETAQEFGVPKVLEIYGSTETGVIAYRFRTNSREELLQNVVSKWFFSSVNNIQVITNYEDNKSSDFVPNISANGVGKICISSPYVLPNPYIGEDLIDLSFSDENNMESHSKRSFELLGRIGRVIKLEDNRISLDEIEHQILSLPEISEVVVVLYMRGNRQYIGAEVVLSSVGKEKLASIGKGKLNLYFRQQLLNLVLPLAVPRSYVISEFLPRLQNGKIDLQKINQHFLEKS